MKSVMSKVLVGLTFAALCAGSASVLSAAETPKLAKELAPARGGQKIMVTSSAFVGGAQIPDRYTQNGENMSPSIEWAKGPSGTRSYVVLAEDAGVERTDPIVHWVVYDINPAVTRLSQAMPGEAKLEIGSQGKNVRGENGYVGPKPPAGQVHPYHFEVFALNTRLNIDPATADRNAIVAAMKGKVLASGDLIGNYTGK